jgi:hypothetical protein
MTNAFAIALLKQDIQNSKRNISYRHNEVGIEALELAIKALEQQPSEDCISRAESLHACCDEWNKDYKAIMKSIRQLPSVTPQPRWIPVSERLPETDGTYLTYIENPYDNELSYVMICNYINPKWFPVDETASSNVIAWMPLPQPYKAESEANTDEN